jgi:uncharacterized membrane protein YeaQ/YmgE (transglycosylase-associated protein family)
MPGKQRGLDASSHQFEAAIRKTAWLGLPMAVSGWAAARVKRRDRQGTTIDMLAGLLGCFLGTPSPIHRLIALGQTLALLRVINNNISNNNNNNNNNNTTTTSLTTLAQPLAILQPTTLD